MASPVGIGHFVTWDGGCMFVSRATAVTPLHSHYATQIAFGSEPGIRFRPTDDVEWTPYDGVVIASRQPHTMDATVVPYNTVIFVEPETRAGRALAERYGTAGIASLDAATSGRLGKLVFDAWLERRSETAVREAAQHVIRELTGGVEPIVVSDERILKAISYINSHLDSELSLDEVASVAFLSPSRFRHLFVEQTGLGLRPYILWRRFVRATELIIMGGESISAAAHIAGFADAAHLTRTSKRMFGFAPSGGQPAAPLAK
jgi:AraC-like DNA-binding protein